MRAAAMRALAGALLVAAAAAAIDPRGMLCHDAGDVALYNVTTLCTSVWSGWFGVLTECPSGMVCRIADRSICPIESFGSKPDAQVNGACPRAACHDTSATPYNSSNPCGNWAAKCDDPQTTDVVEGGGGFCTGVGICYTGCRRAGLSGMSGVSSVDGAWVANNVDYPNGWQYKLSWGDMIFQIASALFFTGILAGLGWGYDKLSASLKKKRQSKESGNKMAEADSESALENAMKMAMLHASAPQLFFIRDVVQLTCAALSMILFVARTMLHGEPVWFFYVECFMMVFYFSDFLFFLRSAEYKLPYVTSIERIVDAVTLMALFTRQMDQISSSYAMPTFIRAITFYSAFKSVIRKSTISELYARIATYAVQAFCGIFMFAAILFLIEGLGQVDTTYLSVMQHVKYDWLTKAGQIHCTAEYGDLKALAEIEDSESTGVGDLWLKFGKPHCTKVHQGDSTKCGNSFGDLSKETQKTAYTQWANAAATDAVLLARTDDAVTAPGACSVTSVKRGGSVVDIGKVELEGCSGSADQDELEKGADALGVYTCRGYPSFNYDIIFPDFFTSMWFIVVTASTVGYGDTSPSTYLGRAVCMVMIVVAIVFFTDFASTLISMISEMNNGGGKYMRNADVPFCVYVGDPCWHSLEAFLDNYFGPSAADNKVELVILCPKSPPDQLEEYIESHLRDGHNIKFLQGSALQDADLARAAVPDAEAVFVCADTNTMEVDSQDTAAIMRAKAVKQYHSSILVLVLLNNSRNKKHAVNVGIPHHHIIVERQLRMNIASKNCSCPGISPLIYLLLSSRPSSWSSEAASSGRETWLTEFMNSHSQHIHDIDLPQSSSGRTFGEVAIEMATRMQPPVCLIGVVVNSKLIINPGFSYVIPPRVFSGVCLGEEQEGGGHMGNPAAMQDLLPTNSPKKVRGVGADFGKRSYQVAPAEPGPDGGADAALKSKGKGWKELDGTMKTVQNLLSKFDHELPAAPLYTPGSEGFDWAETTLPLPKRENLTGHVLCCGSVAAAELMAFVAPLRSDPEFHDCAIVFFGLEAPPDTTYRRLRSHGLHENVYFLKGEVTSTVDFRLAGLAHARRIVFFADTNVMDGGNSLFSEAEPQLMDASCVMLGSWLQRNYPTLYWSIELTQSSSIKFIGKPQKHDAKQKLKQKGLIEGLADGLIDVARDTGSALTDKPQRTKTRVLSSVGEGQARDVLESGVAITKTAGKLMYQLGKVGASTLNTAATMTLALEEKKKSDSNFFFSHPSFASGNVSIANLPHAMLTAVYNAHNPMCVVQGVERTIHYRTMAEANHISSLSKADLEVPTVPVNRTRRKSVELARKFAEELKETSGLASHEEQAFESASAEDEQWSSITVIEALLTGYTLAMFPVVDGDFDGDDATYPTTYGALFTHCMRHSLIVIGLYRKQDQTEVALQSVDKNFTEAQPHYALPNPPMSTVLRPTDRVFVVRCVTGAETKSAPLRRGESNYESAADLEVKLGTLNESVDSLPGVDSEQP